MYEMKSTRIRFIKQSMPESYLIYYRIPGSKNGPIVDNATNSKFPILIMYKRREEFNLLLRSEQYMVIFV